MTKNFEPRQWMSFTQTTKIGTHKNKALHMHYPLSNLCSLQASYMYECHF